MSVEYWIEGRGPTFVYVGGVEGTGRLFYKQAEDLRRDHTVVSFAMRGAGRYRLDELVEDLAWVVERAGGGPATFLGESFGGLLTMAASLARPEMFERMILVNTFPYFFQRVRITLGVSLMTLVPRPLMKAHQTRAARHFLFSPDVGEEDRARFCELTGAVEHEGYVSRLRIIRAADLRPRLKDITIPTLVVAGTADRFLDSVRAARLMAGSIPRARLKLLEGTGHMALLSGRVRVREWLREFDRL
ncbi:MAG TPA: alpha/beta fold hydrolase [Pyrinomonadaceae bacterium]|nr:alpha/beta fold hydrolase [Pyrinomonadaceae bacterium]